MATPTSIIDFPQEEFIMYRPSLMAICKEADNSVCAALILSKFIFWASSKRDVPIYKKMEELVTDLSNGFSRPTVMKQVAWLCEAGYMSRSKNSNPAYKYDKTFRYTVNAPAIQFAINNLSQNIDLTTAPQVKSLTQETTSQVKELTQESESQVKSFTQDDSSQVKSLTDESQKFDLKSASQVKGLTQEGGSQVKSLTSNTIEEKDKKEKKRKEQKKKDTTPKGAGENAIVEAKQEPAKATKQRIIETGSFEDVVIRIWKLFDTPARAGHIMKFLSGKHERHKIAPMNTDEVHAMYLWYYDPVPYGLGREDDVAMPRDFGKLEALVEDFRAHKNYANAMKNQAKHMPSLLRFSWQRSAKPTPPPEEQEWDGIERKIDFTPFHEYQAKQQKYSDYIQLLHHIRDTEGTVKRDDPRFAEYSEEIERCERELQARFAVSSQ